MATTSLAGGTTQAISMALVLQFMTMRLGITITIRFRPNVYAPSDARRGTPLSADVGLAPEKLASKYPCWLRPQHNFSGRSTSGYLGTALFGAPDSLERSPFAHMTSRNLS